MSVSDPAGVEESRLGEPRNELSSAHAASDAESLITAGGGQIAGGGPIRILHVAETVIGGIASHIEEIAGAQAARYGSENVAVILPADQIGELNLPGMLRPFAPARRRVLSAMRVAAATIAQVRALRPHIVHVHSTFAGIAVRLLPRRLLKGAKVVYCPHGWSFAMDRSALHRKLYALVERALSRRCATIINVSRHERDLALSYGLPADRLKVVINGVAAKASSWPTPIRGEGGPMRLVFVGRPGRQKGLDILLAAMKALSGRDFFLDVIGAEATDVSRAGVPADNIAFHGWIPRERAQAFMAASDVLVMPSRWEGLPLTALEAMRAGKAVIASDCSSFGEVVAHGITGLLFETESVPALVTALESVTRDRLRLMGEAGRARFLERFTIGVQEGRIAEIYLELAHG